MVTFCSGLPMMKHYWRRFDSVSQCELAICPTWEVVEALKGFALPYS